MLLAARVRTPEDYPLAMERKLEHLVEKANREDWATAKSMLGPWGTQIQTRDSQEFLADLLATEVVYRFLRSQAPARGAEPATEQEAREVVESQAEVTLVELIGAIETGEES